MIDLEACARSLVAPGKGVLACDESTSTIDERLTAAGIASSEKMRLAYREVFLGAPGIEEFLSGISLSDDLLTPFAKTLHDRDMVPGVKVDEETEPMSESPKEVVTRGLIGLPERLAAYRGEHHTGFAKWRAVLTIDGDQLPSPLAIVENAKRLAMFAKYVQETGMVPVVEMEVLRKGKHSRVRTTAVLEEALTALVRALSDQALDLSGVILQTSMATSGEGSGLKDAPEEVAKDTVAALLKAVPREVLGIVFLSGGQEPDQVTNNLRAIARAGKALGAPWPLSFSFARALTEEGLAIWGGKKENVPAAREAFLARLGKVALAARGE